MVQQYSYKGPIPDGRQEMIKWNALGKAVLTDIKVQAYSGLQDELQKTLGVYLCVCTVCMCVYVHVCMCMYVHVCVCWGLLKSFPAVPLVRKHTVNDHLL